MKNFKIVGFLWTLVLVFALTVGSVWASEPLQVEKVTSADTFIPQGTYIAPKIFIGVNQANYLSPNGSDEGGVIRQDVQVGGALAIGYNFLKEFNVPVRTELEYAVRTDSTFDLDDRNIRARAPQSLFTNIYLDFVNDTKFTPYMGGGVGLGFIGPNTNFAWNAGAGVAYSLTDNVKFDIGYRYVSLGKFEDRHAKGQFNSQEIMTSVRYEF